MMQIDQMPLETPILLLIFNRPEKTQRVFDILRTIEPKQLFIAADGPRTEYPGDLAKCMAAREVVGAVDWECSVQTLFRDRNLGCREAVSSAITWFFSKVDEGIILEDDCVPSQSFFRFSRELLERYRDNQDVMVISGDNYQDGRWASEESYYFSRYPHCWGWASWSRVWNNYDTHMTAWPTARKQGLLSKTSDGDRFFVNYWQNIFDQVHAGKIDSWAYIWTFSCFLNEGLTAIPSNNLVRNIGFDEEATHTVRHNDIVEDREALELNWPLKHPDKIRRSSEADLLVDMFHFSIAPERAVPWIHRLINQVMTPLRKLLWRF